MKRITIIGMFIDANFGLVYYSYLSFEKTKAIGKNRKENLIRPSWAKHFFIKYVTEQKHSSILLEFTGNLVGNSRYEYI